MARPRGGQRQEAFVAAGAENPGLARLEIFRSRGGHEGALAESGGLLNAGALMQDREINQWLGLDTAQPEDP